MIGWCLIDWGWIIEDDCDDDDNNDDDNDDNDPSGGQSWRTDDNEVPNFHP